MDLDTDSYLVEDWEELAKHAASLGQTPKFARKLADHIFFLTLPIKKELKEYGMRRKGEIDRDNLEDIVKRAKKLREEASARRRIPRFK